MRKICGVTMSPQCPHEHLWNAKTRRKFFSVRNAWRDQENLVVKVRIGRKSGLMMLIPDALWLTCQDRLD